MYIRKKAVEFIEQLRSQPYPESEPMRKFFKTKINDKANTLFTNMYLERTNGMMFISAIYLLVLYSKLH